MYDKIPEDRKKRLDALFEALSIVAEGMYVYLCDMKYDFSRWSRRAVDTFRLPSEYMYGAGDIWEEHVHPADREAYHEVISEIFAGNAADHDMQYRAKKPNGEYVVCTCKGIVIRDSEGEPEYFGGAIRNHGIQGHIDMVRTEMKTYVDDILGTLREKRTSVLCQYTDLKTGCVVFIGGGAVLLREYLENSDRIGNCIFIDDLCANAKGYELLYQIQKKGR